MKVILSENPHREIEFREDGELVYREGELELIFTDEAKQDILLSIGDAIMSEIQNESTEK